MFPDFSYTMTLKTRCFSVTSILDEGLVSSKILLKEISIDGVKTSFTLKNTAIL